MKMISFAKFGLSLAFAAAFVACSNDSNTTKVLDNPESSENPGNSENPKQVERLSAAISGSVEFETYLEGAKVEMFELTDGMARSGKSVTGSIDAAGNYVVSADSFTSPYAEVVVSGKAKWPCSGMEMDSWISAVVDVTKDSSVNLNLFAFFASAKAKKLVEKDKMDFAKAWAQAEKDVRKWFALPADGPSLKSLRFSGEDRSLELNAASLWYERLGANFTNKDYSQFRAGGSELFADKDDPSKDEIFYSLGYLAYTFDLDMAYNQWCISSANLTSDDSKYRAYAHSLWLTLMGEEECSANLKDTIHKVESPDDLIVTYNSPRYYVCDGKDWRLAKIEAVPLQFPNPEDGDLVTSYYYDYVYDKESGWRYVTKIELELKKSCVKSRKGTIEGAYFCSDTGWVKMPTLDQNLGAFCNSDTRGDSVHVGYSTFVCDNAWKVIPADTLDEWVEDPRDGKTYLIVPMGSQRWMGSNLRYRDSVRTPNLVGNTWCYNDYTPYCSGPNGVLYSWTAAMDLPDNVKADTVKLTLPHRGVCPEGWHMPSKADWDTLFAFVEKYGPEGKLALALMGDMWAGGATVPVLDAFGFTAMSSGRRKVDGTYEGEYNYGYFWYAAPTFSKLPYYYMVYMQPEIEQGTFGDTDWALSVRCMEDAK